MSLIKTFPTFSRSVSYFLQLDPIKFYLKADAHFKWPTVSLITDFVSVVYGSSLPISREQNIICPWDVGRHTALELVPHKSIPNLPFPIVTAPAIVHTSVMLLKADGIVNDFIHGVIGAAVVPLPPPKGCTLWHRCTKLQK